MVGQWLGHGASRTWWCHSQPAAGCAGACNPNRTTPGVAPFFQPTASGYSQHPVAWRKCRRTHPVHHCATRVTVHRDTVFALDSMVFRAGGRKSRGRKTRSETTAAKAPPVGGSTVRPAVNLAMPTGLEWRQPEPLIQFDDFCTDPKTPQYVPERGPLPLARR